MGRKSVFAAATLYAQTRAKPALLLGFANAPFRPAPIHVTKYCRRRREESLISCWLPNNETPHVVSYSFMNWPCLSPDRRNLQLQTRLSGYKLIFSVLPSRSVSTGLWSWTKSVGALVLRLGSENGFGFKRSVGIGMV